MTNVQKYIHRLYLLYLRYVPLEYYFSHSVRMHAFLSLIVPSFVLYVIALNFFLECDSWYKDHISKCYRQRHWSQCPDKVHNHKRK